MSSPDDAWSVSRLARTLKGRVEDGFDPTWVRGELVGVKRYPSGHWYFGLRDDGAKVSCTMWKGVATRLKVPLEEGMEVFALGLPAVWEERTELRFNVQQVLPTSMVGAAAQQVERTRQRLVADGLLDPLRKRPLPEFPRRIAVVTSIAGAAVRDIITVAARRWPGVELLVIGAAVQGEQAPAELMAALRTVADLPPVDLCIVGRGGGAREDLAAFNDEGVCRAIAACPVPVISAVGHEVDITLADLVADVRAATPSQAAEFALPDRSEVLVRLTGWQEMLGQSMTTILRRRTERLGRTTDRLGNAVLGRLRAAERRVHAVERSLPATLERRVRGPRERLVRMEQRLAPAMQRILADRTATLERHAAALDALSPLAVLGRGFAMPRDADGRVLRRVAEFTPGAPFTLRVTDGDVQARTEE